MGVKRPLDEDTIQELTFKQAKQLDDNNKPTEIAEDVSPVEVSQKGPIPCDFEGKVGESEFGGEHEGDKPHKELETSASLSWVTSSSSEEEAGNARSFFLPRYPDFFELNIPRRPPIQFEDAYSYLLNSSPRKEVPVGPDYQADVPEWDSDAIRKDALRSSYSTDDDNEQILVGTSIIPMPDTNVLSCDDMKLGHGRMDCYCSDKGSIRCGRQHIVEARERLRESIGEEKFADLGFLSMGEEVARQWTEEEERIFHEVVYSNPVSLGKNFWQHLSVVFPSRTKMEIVSYYFNVFILHRRAVQNRCSFLDIDSDDDEWQGDGRYPRVEGDDDDSVVESFNDEDIEVDHEIGDDNEDRNDDDDDDDNGDDDGDGDVGTSWGDASERGDQERKMSKEPAETFKEGSGFDSNTNNLDKVVSNNIEDHAAGAYYDRHHFMMAFSGSVGEDNTTRENVLRSDNMRCSEGLSNGNEALSTGFVLEHCDAKAWHDTFSTNHFKNIDLLPTCSMIKEIFGPCSWKNN